MENFEADNSIRYCSLKLIWKLIDVLTKVYGSRRQNCWSTLIQRSFGKGDFHMGDVFEFNDIFFGNHYLISNSSIAKT